MEVINSNNVFFVGLMGAGKTTIGRLLAKHLDKAFYDTDYEIERRTGVKSHLFLRWKLKQVFAVVKL